METTDREDCTLAAWYRSFTHLAREGRMTVTIGPRELLAALGGAVVAWPLAARAQQAAMPVIGFLSSRSPGESADLVAAFRQSLAEGGYVEGQNVSLEFRWGEGRYERLAGYAAELVRRAVTVIVTAGGDPAAQAAKAATATIPIVFVSGSDPVKVGLVASLNRPGGNITGVHMLILGLGAKRLGLLHESHARGQSRRHSGESEFRRCPDAIARRRGRGPIAWAEARCPEGRHGVRDRHRVRRSRPAEDRRDPRDRRSILHEPTRSDRRAGGKVCDACDVRIARVRGSRRPDELRARPRRWISPGRRLRGQNS